MHNDSQICCEYRAMILAAGEGVRLRPLTGDCPKPMIRVGSAPILEYNVRLLRRHGIEDIAINLHYHPETITEYFGDGSRLGVHLQYSYEPQLLGTAGAVMKLRDFFAGSNFFVLYGDNLTNCNLGKVAARHRDAGAVCTIALFQREDVRASGVAQVTADGQITGFVEKPLPGTEPSHWVSAGVLCFDERVFDHIPSKGPSDFGRDVIPELLRNGLPVSAYFMTETLMWVDTAEDHQRTQEAILQGSPELAFLRL